MMAVVSEVSKGSERPERVVAEPTKLLKIWMEWENGETPPGKVISNLKTAGMRDLLEALVDAQQDVANTGAGSNDGPSDFS